MSFYDGRVSDVVSMDNICAAPFDHARATLKMKCMNDGEDNDDDDDDENAVYVYDMYIHI